MAETWKITAPLDTKILSEVNFEYIKLERVRRDSCHTGHIIGGAGASGGHAVSRIACE